MTAEKTPTHRFTSLGSGRVFLVSRVDKDSDSFWFAEEGDGSVGWHRATHFSFYTRNTSWKVEELNRFKGNV